MRANTETTTKLLDDNSGEGKLIYLASPYNDGSHIVRQRRYEEACRACAWLMQAGRFVYSPIVHNHPLATDYELPKGWDYWQTADTLLLTKCDAMLILTIPGWRESRGAKAERLFALSRGIPVKLLIPTESGYKLAEVEYEQIAI